MRSRLKHPSSGEARTPQDPRGMGPAGVNRLACRPGRRSPASIPSAVRLTPREQQVLQLLWDGLVIKEVAMVLDLSFARAAQIREQLGLKFQVHTTVQLVRAGLAQGYLELPR